jgi:hypothetical protein
MGRIRHGGGGMSNARFSIIPAWVVCDPRMIGKDLQVIALLGQYTDKEGWCRRSQVKMAEQLSCARSTVQAALDRLAGIGAVEKRVEPSRDGRDSALWYRVIFDRKVADEAFEAWEIEADNEEFDPISAVSTATPPAGIPAPPAGPEPAPPAGPGPAPINEDSLTTLDKRGEKERASLSGEEEENPKALERRFRKWWSTWPSYATDTEMTTRRAWMALTPQQRRDCEDRTPAYLASVKAIGRSFTKAAATYLSERAWERVGAGTVASQAAPTTHKAFSRAWQGLALAEMLGPEKPLPRMPDALARLVLQGGPVAEAEKRAHRMRWAWPKVREMYEGRGAVQVSAEIVEASQGFRAYGINQHASIIAAWKRLYDERGWPWPEMGTAEWICFPVTDGDTDADVDAALQSFKDAISKGQGDEHAA